MTSIGQALKKQQYDAFPLIGKGKLIVTKEVQSKIDLLHKEVGSIEWCGIFTYVKETGHITDPSSVLVRTVDVYPMDIGTHSYTEFDSDDPNAMCDLMDRMPSYLDHRYGMIHTHHTMDTFFSGTDIQELHDNVANYDPYYISLIVNFKGKYTAKIAFLKAIEERKISVIDEDKKEEFITVGGKNVMFTFDLDVEIETSNVEHPVIMQRLEEIRADKKAKAKASTPVIVKGYQGRRHDGSSWDDNDPDVWKGYKSFSSKQEVIQFPLDKATKIKAFLPKIIMQNMEYKGNMWEAFVNTQKEVAKDPGMIDMIYTIWAENIYEQVMDEFDCRTFDEAQDIFREMIKILDNLKTVALYGDHVVKMIEILNIYITSIEVG